MSRLLRYWPLLFLGGGGLLVILLLEALRASGSVRRLLALGVGGFLAAALVAAAAGNIGLRFSGPDRPEAAYTAAGVMFLATLATVAAAMAVTVYRKRQRQRAASTSSATQSTSLATPLPQLVVVQGAPPEVAATLERELQVMAALVGMPLVVQVAPRCPVRGRRLERGILLQVPRPRMPLVLAALEMVFQGGEGLPATTGGVSSSQAQWEEDKEGKAGEAAATTTTTAKRKKPRPEELAAAIGGQGQQ